MSIRQSTETMDTARGSFGESSRQGPLTQDEMQREQQDCKDGYIKWSLQIKQLQVNGEIERVEVAKSKLVEMKKDILNDVDKAHLILSGAITKIAEASQVLGP